MLSLVCLLLASRAEAHAQHPLSADDSIILARSASHVALESSPTLDPACILAIGDSTGTAAGRAFIAEGRAIAGTLPVPRSSASELALQPLRADGEDTARVEVRVSGSNGAQASSFWINDFAYHFTRTSSAIRWQLLDRRPTYFADHIVDGGAPAPRRCLNHAP